MIIDMYLIYLLSLFGIILTQTTFVTPNLVENVTVFPTQGTCIRSFNEKCRRKRVIGGTASHLGDWPWIVALGYQSSENGTLKWLCAGTLITNKHVITAAHCVVDLVFSKLTTVRLGELDFNDTIIDGSKTLDVPIKRIINHVKYNSNTITNDIALLVLNDYVPFTDYIKPICLPITSQGWDDINFDGTDMYVVGWGRTSNDKLSRRPTSLREVKVPIMTIGECRAAYANQINIIDSSVLCAGAEGKDTCQGDSGGPLMFQKDDQYYLMGIVSYGSIECGILGSPGVYTRVTYFIDWILKGIKDT